MGGDIAQLFADGAGRGLGDQLAGDQQGQQFILREPHDRQLKGWIGVEIALAGIVILQRGVQPVAEVVDGAMGGLGGELELICQLGGIGIAAMAGFVVKPDEPF